MKIVLIVDDEEGFLRSLAEGLNASCSDKFRVLTAHNGEEALRVLELTDISLVVTDLLMPCLDGYGLLGQIKLQWPWIPIIVMSAHLDHEAESRLKAMGVSHFLEKPLDFDHVATSIRDKVSSVSGQNEEVFVP
ncbi:MAG: response regulator [Chloroflexota bacterium]